MPADAPPPPPGSWVEVRAGAVEVLARPVRPFPDPAGDWARFHGEGGRRGGHLLARAALRRATRAFFEARGFLEVDTPLLVANPGLDLHLAPFEVPPDGWLTTSPELALKRLVGAGVARVFEVGRSFRRGEHGALHEPEFALLEWYRAFEPGEAILDDTEALVVEAARALGHHDLVVRRPDGPAVDLTPPWPRLAVRDAFARFAGVSMDETLDDEERFYRVLVEAVEPALARSGRPAFLTRWPAAMASLARLCPDDPTVAARFEAYAGGLELSNGFEELVDPVEQRARFERDLDARRARGLPAPAIDEAFLAALEEGLPPTSGNALGLDRLLLLLREEGALEAVVPFPHDARRRHSPAGGGGALR